MGSHWLLLITCNYQLTLTNFGEVLKECREPHINSLFFLANYDFVPLNKTTTKRELNARSYKVMEGGGHSSIRQPKARPEV